MMFSIFMSDSNPLSICSTLVHRSSIVAVLEVFSLYFLVPPVLGASEIDISTGGYFGTVSGNAIFTGGFFKKTPVEIIFLLAAFIKKTASENNVSTSRFLN
jgi:hypothetical protein